MQLIWNHKQTQNIFYLRLKLETLLNPIIHLVICFHTTQDTLMYKYLLPGFGAIN